MGYTAQGQAPPFLHTLAAKVVNASSKIDRNDVMAVIEGYRQLHSRYSALLAVNNGLNNDILRLRHENEFMLKLVNGMNQSNDAT